LELLEFYSFANIRLAGHVACMDEILRKKNTKENKLRWEEDFEMDLIETG
jgi:hypothetical protein